MSDKLEAIAIEINANLASIAVSLKKIADSSERVEITGTLPEANEAMEFGKKITKEIEQGPKYKEHNEVGKGPVMEKTCGKEVCRCLRNDGSCAAHHPEFCPRCIRLNR